MVAAGFLVEKVLAISATMQPSKPTTLKGADSQHRTQYHTQQVAALDKEKEQGGRTHPCHMAVGVQGGEHQAQPTRATQCSGNAGGGGGVAQRGAGDLGHRNEHIAARMVTSNS